MTCPKRRKNIKETVARRGCSGTLVTSPSGAQIDQRDAQFRNLGAAQMAGRFNNGDFKRWLHGCFQQMPTTSRSVTHPEHHMDMKARLAPAIEGEVTNGAQHFALLVYRDLAVGFRQKVEPAHGRRESGKPAMVLLADNGRYIGGAFVTFRADKRQQLWERAQGKAGAPPPTGLAKEKAEWLKPGLVGLVRFLKGEEKLRHATLKDFWET